MCIRDRLLVEHYSRRLDYIKKKKIELDEYIVEDCKYVRELDVPFHTNYFYQQSLFSENINVAKHIFDPELDPSVRLYNHLYRKSFLESKGHSRICLLYTSTRRDETKRPPKNWQRTRNLHEP